MRHTAKILAALAAVFATPSAAQSIAYEDVLFTDTSVALLEEAPAVSHAAEHRAPHIAYETPVELETQRAITTFRTAPEPVAEQKVARVEYGPFRVLDDNRVALVGMIERATPRQFAQLLKDHPTIGMIEMVEAPGTNDDLANFELGRMIKAARLVTYVPAHGSVRSGAVELFLAGERRIAHAAAEFAVHSWMDVYGREASDFADDHPVNRSYIDYYVEMGLDESDAKRFYAMTNSVPHHSALWLTTREMERYVEIERTS